MILEQYLLLKCLRRTI